MEFFTNLDHNHPGALGELLIQLSIDKPGFPNDASNMDAWEGLRYLLSRRYWTRTWVYHEASVHRVVFFCGIRHFFFRQLIDTNAIAVHYGRLPG